MERPPLVARINPLPVEITPALASRRRTLASEATGRVLDLGDWSDHLDDYRVGDAVDEVVHAPGPSGVDPDAGPFDSIVSLVRSPLVADLDGYIEWLLESLAPDGRIGFLEPVCRPGRTGRLLELGGRLGRSLGGLHLDRDIPADLRSHGLVVTDLYRFEVASLSAPLRPFTLGWARRPVAS